MTAVLDRIDSLYKALGPENLIVLMAGLGAFLTVVAVWHALLAPNPLGVRVKTLEKRRRALQAGLLAPKHSRHRRVHEAVGLMHRITERLDLVRSAQARKIAERLAQAGWRSKDAMVVFLFLKLGLPFVFGGAAAVALYALDVFEMPALARLLAALASVVVGAYAPEVYVKNAIQKRGKKIQKGLPDALDLLVISAEAGLSLDASLARVAREIERSAPEVADELALTAIELGFLPERRQALENLIKRVGLPSMRGVVNTLLQTEKYGTPLAHSLRVLSAEFRDERMLKAEEKAAKLPATLTVPLVVFILPTLFVVLLGPAILKAIDGLSKL